MSETPMTLPMIIRAQYVKDLSFESPNPIAAFTEDQETQPAISVNIQAKADNLGSGNFEVILDVRVEGKRKESILFLTELSYGAVVSVEGIDEKDASPLIMIEAPHLMFPFVRNIICDVTREGGFPPLMLAPVDFASLYRQQQEQASKAQEHASSH